MNSSWRGRMLLLMLVSLFAISIYFISKNQRAKAYPLAAAGGEGFADFNPIQTPYFLQTDPQWADDTIGGSDEKLSTEGSTVCCLAMALGAFDIETTPKELNEFLKAHGGYNFRGWLKWSAVAKFAEGKVVVDHAAPLRHTSIDSALRAGNPVMTKLLIKHNTAEHWVLVVGKEGAEYLVRDPLGDGGNLDKLSKFDSRIFAIRVVKRAGAGD